MNCTMSLTLCVGHDQDTGSMKYLLKAIQKNGLSQKPARIGMITARQFVGLHAGPFFLDLVLLLKTVNFVQK